MSVPDDRAADDWWGNLPATRRAQIYRWITSGGGHGGEHVPLEGELMLPLFLAPHVPDQPPRIPRPIETLESL